MKKVAFITLGCKVNQYETNAMRQQFMKKGYEILELARTGITGLGRGIGNVTYLED